MTISPKEKDVLEGDFDSYVKRIEVEKVFGDTEDPWPKFYRAIRFTTHSGEVLVVNCDSDSPEDLELVEVDQLQPVQRPKAKSRDWMKPKTAKGKSHANRK